MAKKKRTKKCTSKKRKGIEKVVKKVVCTRAPKSKKHSTDSESKTSSSEGLTPVQESTHDASTPSVTNEENLVQSTCS